MADAPWTVARYLGREKRFTVHAELAGGERVTVHTNNTGRLTGCGEPGARCWLSPASNPRRKLPWTLEVMEAPAWPNGMAASSSAPEAPIPLDAPAPAPDQVLVGVNTAAPHGIVIAALEAGLIAELADCTLDRQEARYPADIAPRSRADLLLRDPAGAPVWVEIKNVTWTRGGVAGFPDAPTERGRKHLADLARCVDRGQRAALVLCVQRGDAHCVAAAADIDPDYAVALHQAALSGVACCGLLARVSPAGVEPAGSIAVITDPTNLPGVRA